MVLRNMAVLILVALLGAARARAQAVVQCIAPGGSNSFSGLTTASPKATLQAALNALAKTGGVVYAAPGTYPDTNVASSTPGVSIVGEGPVGFGWVGGMEGGPIFQSSTGTTLEAGTPAQITDPGWNIQGVAFENANGGSSEYGLHIERMRNVTLRDVVFSNYQPNGTALFLDGTSSGYVEWSDLDNVTWANCPHALVINNGTDTQISHAIFGLSQEFTGSVGILEEGNSDTLQTFGAAINEYDTSVDLNSSEGGSIEAAALYGLRIENHQNNASSVGVLVSSGYNRIEGEYWMSGVGMGVKLLPSSTKNVVLPSAFTNVGISVLDQGTNNQVLGVN